MKPMQPARFPPGSEPKLIFEECWRQSARVNELMRGNHDHICSIQEYYRAVSSTPRAMSRSRSRSRWKSLMMDSEAKAH